MRMREEFIQIPVTDPNLPFSITLAGISYCDGTYKIVRKNSKIACIEYIIKGSGTININGKVYYPKEGESYFLPQGTDHEYFSSSDDPWEKVWVNVSGELVSTLAKIYRIDKHILFDCDASLYILRMHEILKNTTLLPDEAMKKCLVYFLELVQFLSQNNKQGQISVPANAQLLKNYIDSNIYSQITIDDLAKLIFKSKSQTIRIFKSAFGVSPYDYYMDNRIKKAVYLLENTAFSIKEIAFKLGFCDTHYFSSLFKKKTGKSPRDYRKYS